MTSELFTIEGKRKYLTAEEQVKTHLLSLRSDALVNARYGCCGLGPPV